MTTALPLDIQVADFVGEFIYDPLGFVMGAYPWGEPGPLQNYGGPDEWQRTILEDIGKAVRERGFDGMNAVAPIREAVASGHGIGKSVMVAWLVDWIMSTRPNAKGTITANTFPQLQTRTWAQIQRWTKLCITASWFTVTGDTMYHNEHPETWRCSAQTCREENSEAFAGQHAADSTSFYIFDEASAIPDKIWEVAEGGLTDGESMIFAFGNPTRNCGKFYRACFGQDRARWSNRSIDSRSSRFTNKTQIAEWVADYGEDSDFVRVRVKGLPPSTSDIQFIDTERVMSAQRRRIDVPLSTPLLVGVDFSRGGGDNTVVRFRRGPDAATIPPVVITGEKSRDTMAVVAVLAVILSETAPEKRVDHMFVDAAFGGPAADRLRQMGFANVSEVNFGGSSPDEHQANMRAHMWSNMRNWLANGCIDTSTTLEVDLTGPGFKMNSRDQLLLESKEDMAKRGLASPDHGDALALTFAQPVIARGLIAPEFSPVLHVCDTLPRRLSRYCAILPRPTGSHAILWVGADKWGDVWVYRELLMPSGDFTLREHGDAVASLEGGVFVLNRPGTDSEGGRIQDTSERVRVRLLAAYEMPDEQIEDWQARFGRYGLAVTPCELAPGLCDDALKAWLRGRVVDGVERPRLHVAESCVQLIDELRTVRAEPRIKGERGPVLIECLRALAGYGVRWAESLES